MAFASFAEFLSGIIANTGKGVSGFLCPFLLSIVNCQLSFSQMKKPAISRLFYINYVFSIADCRLSTVRLN